LAIAEPATCQESFRYYKVQRSMDGFSRIALKKEFPFVDVQFAEQFCILSSLDMDFLDLTTPPRLNNMDGFDNDADN